MVMDMDILLPDAVCKRACGNAQHSGYQNNNKILTVNKIQKQVCQG